MQKVVVLIFTHKAKPDADELLSFRQCCEVFGKHPMRLVCPRGMDLSAYRAIHPDIVPDFIDPKWFRTMRDYNLLKVLPWLYRRYAGYEFMLTYELDAWVFRDELLYWCEQGWDYIGAPWFEGYYDCREDSPVLGVGNSGFSLRRICTMQRAGRAMRRKVLLMRSYMRVNLRRFRSSGYFRDLIAGHVQLEDDYWCRFVAPRLEWFKLAPYEAARRFAFEANAPRLHRECGGQLPFGCHKPRELHPEFWRPFIPNCC
jgi:hypothetical protein